MNHPEKYIQINDGVIVLFNKRLPADNQDIILEVVNNELCIMYADYCIPVSYLKIDESTSKYTIFLSASNEGEKEVVIISELKLAEQFIGKILLLKESYMWPLILLGKNS